MKDEQHRQFNIMLTLAFNSFILDLVGFRMECGDEAELDPNPHPSCSSHHIIHYNITPWLPATC